jgi:Fuc2NAc and GlcNAc transferase
VSLTVDLAILAGAFAVVGASSFLVTGVIRWFAIKRNVVDVPNSRSSHTVPTPRGGGGAIVVVTLAALCVAWNGGWLPAKIMWALLGSGTIVSLVGFLDDSGHVAARRRLLAHFTAALWAMWWMGGLPPLSILGAVVDLGWVGHGLAVLYLVWMLNLYNFMDGIDGIAGLEAVLVCLGGVALYLLSPRDLSEPGAWWVPMALAGAAAGFLVWNFPRARIFMGDVGSGFIGIQLGILSIWAGSLAPDLFWAWLVLLGAFVVDATVTLLGRLRRGERVYEAHCGHAYQRASRRLGSHVRVSLAFSAINILWLFPIAALIAVERVDGALGLVLAYAPLTWISSSYREGGEEEGTGAHPAERST